MTLRPLISRFFRSRPHTSAAAAPAITPVVSAAATIADVVIVPERVEAPPPLAREIPAASPTPSAEGRLLQTILFGNAGNDTHFLGVGWAFGGHFRWLSGSSSEIWLEHPGPGRRFMLELDLQAEQTELMPHAQRISIVVRGVIIGRTVLTGRRQLRYTLPGEIVEGQGPIRIVLQHEDAVQLNPRTEPKQRPQGPLRCHALRLWQMADHPTVALEPGPGLAVDDMARLSGMPADTFICLFESLGDNCEFGTVQRLCGAEPLSLMRFGAPRLPRLLECLRTRFEHFGAIENLEFMLGDTPRREYTIREKRYGMQYHTFQFQGEIDESQLIVKQAARLKLLVRKLLEDLEDGQKILIWKDTSGDYTEADARKLHAELATFAANTLLWVTIADEDHRAGSVEWISAGLLKGYVHRFSYPVPNVDLPPWLEICVNAHRLVHGGNIHENDAVDILPAAPPLPRAAQPPLFEAMVARGMAHVQNRGDIHAGMDGWIGVPESRNAIEGLVILDDLAIADAGLTYQVVLADGSLSEEASMSVFRGTRGKNQALRGVHFSLSEERAKSIRLRCEVRFVDGLHLHDIASGTVCKAESGSSLEAIRLTLEPLS